MTTTKATYRVEVMSNGLTRIESLTSGLVATFVTSTGEEHFGGFRGARKAFEIHKATGELWIEITHD